MLMRLFYNLLAARAPVYVISHERSGTHLALNLIYTNFYIRHAFYDVPLWRGPYHYPADARIYWESLMRQKAPELERQGGLVKCHCEAEIFEKHFPRAPVVYIVRDPRDVLVSFYHYLNHPEVYRNNPWMEDQRCASFSEFLHRPLTPFLRLGFALRENARNVMERWAEHVRGWLLAPNVVHVRYEDMVRHHRRVIRKVAAVTGLRPRLRTRAIRFGEGGSILPRKGKIGDWKNYFTAADEKSLALALAAKGLVLGADGEVQRAV
jgi:hypothetical protein